MVIFRLEFQVSLSLCRQILWKTLPSVLGLIVESYTLRDYEVWSRRFTVQDKPKVQNELKAIKSI